MKTDTASRTPTSELESRRDARHPQIILVLDRAHPLSGGARHSLASITRVTIGRARKRGSERIVENGAPTLRILLQDDRVSGSHAALEHQDGAWHFADCGSTNGSRVNGREVRKSQLADGDILEI